MLKQKVKGKKTGEGIKDAYVKLTNSKYYTFNSFFIWCNGGTFDSNIIFLGGIGGINCYCEIQNLDLVT